VSVTRALVPPILFWAFTRAALTLAGLLVPARA
jgi:hypothetical protein